MGKTLGIILAVLIVAVGAPNAHADTITDGTINFTVTIGGPGPIPTGSFLFDNTTNSFTSFSVLWDGFLFDFSGTANGLTGVTLGGCSSAGVFTFLVENGCGANPSWGAASRITSFPAGFGIFSFEKNPPSPFAAFELTVQGLVPPPFTIDEFGVFGTVTTPVSTPEPSSVALMLAGIGFVLVMRTRKCHGLRPGS